MIPSNSIWGWSCCRCFCRKPVLRLVPSLLIGLAAASLSTATYLGLFTCKQHWAIILIAPSFLLITLLIRLIDTIYISTPAYLLIDLRACSSVSYAVSGGSRAVQKRLTMLLCVEMVCGRIDKVSSMYRGNEHLYYHSTSYLLWTQSKGASEFHVHVRADRGFNTKQKYLVRVITKSVLNVVNLLLIHPIWYSFKFLLIQTGIVIICSPLIVFFCRGSVLLADNFHLYQPMSIVLLLQRNFIC